MGEETDARELDLALAPAGAREENLYVAGERLAARAASPATRRQYASIYRTFGDWLRAELDRPPTTSDLTGDAIGAFGRHLDQGWAWGRARLAPPGASTSIWSACSRWRCEQRDHSIAAARLALSSRDLSSGPGRLAALATVLEEAERALRMEVALARGLGVSWSEIGASLGVTRQAAPAG